jgi:NAD+ kinase
MLERVAVLYNPLSDASIKLSHELTDWLTARGVKAIRGVSQELVGVRKTVTGAES